VVKNYGTVWRSREPETPVAISLTLLPRLIERDVKLLSADRNVPEALRVVARRMLFVENARGASAACRDVHSCAAAR
jgi:hypothetical protein